MVKPTKVQQELIDLMAASPLSFIGLVQSHILGINYHVYNEAGTDQVYRKHVLNTTIRALNSRGIIKNFLLSDIPGLIDEHNRRCSLANIQPSTRSFGFVLASNIPSSDKDTSRTSDLQVHDETHTVQD